MRHKHLQRGRIHKASANPHGVIRVYAVVISYCHPGSRKGQIFADEVTLCLQDKS